MLNFAALKLIKPTGCIDDYEAGAGNDDSPVSRGKVIKQAIWDALSNSTRLSADDIAKTTGASKGAVHRNLIQLHKKELVTVFKDRAIINAKPTHYYSLVQSC